MELSLKEKYYKVRDGSFVKLTSKVGDKFTGIILFYSSTKEGKVGYWNQVGRYMLENKPKHYLDIIEKSSSKEFKKHERKIIKEQKELWDSYFKDPIFEPLIIDSGKDHWVHPHIDEYCGFGDPSGKKNDNPMCCMVELSDKSGNNLLRMAVMSKTVHDFWEKFFAGREENKISDEEYNTDKHIVRCPYAEEDMILADWVSCMTDAYLNSEDIWFPDGEDFALTRLGKRISKIFKKDWYISYCPYIMVWKDYGEYGFDT